jgi:hypothetical protein
MFSWKWWAVFGVEFLVLGVAANIAAYLLIEHYRPKPAPVVVKPCRRTVKKTSPEGAA